MKPTFALDLTSEAIGLLHRTPKGWLPIGETAFDAPDLAEAMDYLRKTALGLSPLGVATKLILPNSQILYTEIHAPGPSRDEKRRQIATALEGRTPYEVEDLVFDWSGKGATVKVAVIARETLEQAEGFAAEHRLNPVSFVAIPEDGAFVGEPWFGPTTAAASILAYDEKVERDREPVVVLHRELPKAEPSAPVVELAAEPAPVAEPTPVVEASVPVEDEPLPGLEEALNAELPEPPPAPTATEPAPATEAADEGAEDGLDAASLRDLEAALADDGPVADAPSIAAAVEEPATPVAPATAADPDEAPFAHVTDSAAFPEPEDSLPPAPAARKPVIDDLDDDIPPAPPSAAMVAFASRRAASADAIPRPMEGVTRPNLAASGGKAGGIARPAPVGKGFPGMVTAPSIPGTRAKPKLKGGEIPRPATAGPTTVKSPARPGGTFGTVAPAKKRTGTVFLVMVALLLLFLALVAAWASYFISGNGATTTTDEASVTDTTPGVDDEMLADMQDPEGMTAPLPEAETAPQTEADAGTLATESLPVNMGGEDPAATTEATAVAAAPEPVDPAAVDVATEAAPAATPAPVSEPAPGTVVATDVSAASAPAEDQDEIFLSAMDAPPPALDALALPALADVTDALPDPAMPPPAPGTVYQFDAKGLLKPTPEGIVSPDGVMLIAGKPPKLPPARSDVATAAALAAAAVSPPPVTEPAASDASLVTAAPAAEAPLPPSDPAMAGFRPKTRPEGLAPATAGDDAALAPETASEFAGIRPLARPASVTAAAAAAAPVQAADLGAQGASLTAQAEAKLAEAAALEAKNPSIVAISMRPAARPNDFKGAVEAAVAAAVREPAPVEEAAPVKVAAAPEAKPEETADLDEPEPTKVAPSIPTKASVAKQATYANAINLSKINLIGTYGTDSRRYALIRQANGKYKKVKVGDKIDGGTVKAITDTEVRYQKGGRLVSLKMPKA